MSRHHSYLNSAKQILQQYKGEEPFASFLKKFFSANRKYGSTDRKQIAQLCYSYFRFGKAAKEFGVDQELIVADIFPWKDELSKGIDHTEFCRSFLVQPDLFLRLRPGYEETVKSKLSTNGIEFKEINKQCIALPNSTKIETIIEVDKEAVVQDYNSQRIGNFMSVLHAGASAKAWDCCAASGGKSILLYDLHPEIDLTVSDVRESILINLKKRFERAGIKRYHSFIADLSRPQPKSKSFDLIICDAPCTGSGTWSRTPEQLFYFDEKKIDEYAALQKSILSNIMPAVNRNGYLLYITCSVFRKENEEALAFIESNSSLKLVKKEVLKGYEMKADTMFAALFKA